MEHEIRHLVELNGGFVLRAHVIALGGSDAQIREAVRTGTLVRIRVGTYALRDAWRRLDPVGRHLVLAASAMSKFPTGSVALSHHSAAAAHGLSLFDADLSTVRLLRLDGGAGRRESGIVHHAARLQEHDVTEVGDFLVVEPARATWQVACESSPRGALVVMDSALHHGLVSREQLDDAQGRFRAWRGARAARLMARAANGDAESAGETLLRFVCIAHHLPVPTLQVEIRDEDGRLVGRADAGWLDHRHLGEFDGFRKYWRDLRPGEDAAEAVIREKRREDGFRRLLYGVSRADWHDVLPHSAAATAARLAHDLEQSHRLYARGRRHIA